MVYMLSPVLSCCFSNCLVFCFHLFYYLCKQESLVSILAELTDVGCIGEYFSLLWGVFSHYYFAYFPIFFSSVFTFTQKFKHTCMHTHTETEAHVHAYSHRNSSIHTCIHTHMQCTSLLLALNALPKFTDDVFIFLFFSPFFLSSSCQSLNFSCVNTQDLEHSKKETSFAVDVLGR